MDKELLPTTESLKRYKDMDRAEVRTCPICNTEVKNGDRTVRFSADGTREWVHYWHADPAKK